jgi:bifunctional ADP-heptose synthase (sugar kinase/adenylyltransferase)
MKRILVIGESCRDIFVYCDSTRLAPDLPVPILQPKTTKENPGMAMNVFRNIKSLHDACDIHTNDKWEKVTKTRYVHERSNHLFLRIDENDLIGRISFKNVDFNYDCVVISDYNKGFLSADDIEYICSNHPCVFIDTKKPLGVWARNSRYIKINKYEYTRSSCEIVREYDDKIICTLGGDGAIFRGKKFGVNYVDARDTSGAGDSFMAALVVRFMQTDDIEESIKYANQKASTIVSIRGVGVID